MTQILASITVDSVSSDFSTEFNPFDEDNHSAFSATANVTAAGITYTQSNGRFTVSEDGTYRIWGMLIVEDRSGGTPTLVTLQVKVDGAAVYTIPGMAVHSVADPVLVPFGILRTLTANRYVEVTLTEDAANDIRTTPGCTLNVVRIA